MKKYPALLIEEICNLRSGGRTYSEIKREINVQIPKSTLSYLCKNVVLPEIYLRRVEKINEANRNKGRLIAIEVNRLKREKFLKGLDEKNSPIFIRINENKTAKIALAMLCLGEASKYSSKSSCFSLGNSDPRIIIIFLSLLKKCFDFNVKKLRCTVQCRADQNTKELEKFWQNVTGVPKNLFYKTKIDPRTIGKPTEKKDYKGVLRVDYFDSKVQLELESLANLIYNELNKKGPVVYR